MSEQIIINRGADKATIYRSLLPQTAALLQGETDTIASMANVAAIIKEAFSHLWVGFYIVRGNQLVVGPFQGPVACMRIGSQRGVCAAAWQSATTVVVDDVELFEGHIACSSLSRSEIVVPLLNADKCVTAVLDIDSVQLAAFDHIDRYWLEQLVALIPVD